MQEAGAVGEELKNIASAVMGALTGREENRHWASRPQIETLLEAHIAKAHSELLLTHKLGKEIAAIEAEKDRRKKRGII